MKNKSYLAVILVALLAITAIIVGAAYLNTDSVNVESEGSTSLLDINETSEYVAIDTKEATNNFLDDLADVDDLDDMDNSSDDVTSTIESEARKRKTESTTNTTIKETPTETPIAHEKVAADTAVLHFSDEDNLSWPIKGKILIDYNMKNTIYFKTLNQYKCSPAILISGNINDEVKSSARGQIKKVSNNEEIGNFVVMTLGDGYEVTYGCLKDIQVSEGQVIDGGTLIGYVNDPTKYYTKEGSGVYLKMTKDDKVINPRYFLDVSR